MTGELAARILIAHVNIILKGDKIASKDMVLELKSAALADRDEAQASVDKLDALNAEIAKEVEASYDEGVKANQDAVGNSEGKIYSLEETNQFIADAKKPLEDQIADLGVKIADLQAKVDAAPDVESAKAEARKEVKEQILAKMTEQQTSESEGEANLKSLVESL